MIWDMTLQDWLKATVGGLLAFSLLVAYCWVLEMVRWVVA